MVRSRVRYCGKARASGSIASNSRCGMLPKCLPVSPSIAMLGAWVRATAEQSKPQTGREGESNAVVQRSCRSRVDGFCYLSVGNRSRSEEHTSELQSLRHLV